MKWFNGTWRNQKTSGFRSKKRPDKGKIVRQLGVNFGIDFSHKVGDEKLQKISQTKGHDTKITLK